MIASGIRHFISGGAAMTDQVDVASNPVLDAALALARRGIPVFPCLWKDRDGKKAKEPLTEHGFKDATTDERQIRRWWREWPSAMIGMPTGEASGIDVLDLDYEPDEYVDGFQHVPKWKTLSPVIADTPSDGAHLYFKASGIRNSASEIAPNVDTKGHGGYVIVPPSYCYGGSHSSKGEYRFYKGSFDLIDRLPPFPEDLAQRLDKTGQGEASDDPQADPQRVAAAMRVIPNPDLGWDQWNKFGMAIYAATGGSDEGFEIFDEWSRKSSAKYNEAETVAKWDGLHRSPPTRIGAGTIFWEANRIDRTWATGGAPILSNKTPLKTAHEFITRQFNADGSSSLVHYRGDFYEWTGTHYEECEKDDLRSRLYGFLDKAVTPGRRGYEPFNPDSNKVNKVLDALAAGVQEKGTANAPFWLVPHDDEPSKLIACRNGLLNWETRQLLPHTPQFFNVNCLPFDYQPEAPIYPEQWLEFLRQLWPGDGDGRRARHALQEMFGLMLTLDTSYQKIFAIIGPKRSGKGTIARVLRALLGKDNVVGPTLASLSTQFGLWPCINKQVGIISDARLGKASNVQAIAERLLAISGEDALTIDRKYKEAWTGPLPLRFLILSNELPQIPDVSGALASRFVILMLTRSFYGKEDLTLTDKLLTELPGILNWALAGLQRLRKYGYFEMPDASLAAIRQLENLASPVRAFLRDWCETSDADASVRVKELYAAYRHWCSDHGVGVSNSIVFGRNLHAAQPSSKVRGRGERRHYTGVRLSREGRILYAEAEAARVKKKSVPDDE
jgi:putative DNA primase/helicase